MTRITAAYNLRMAFSAVILMKPILDACLLPGFNCIIKIAKSSKNYIFPIDTYLSLPLSILLIPGYANYSTCVGFGNFVVSFVCCNGNISEITDAVISWNAIDMVYLQCWKLTINI